MSTTTPCALEGYWYTTVHGESMTLGTVMDTTIIVPDDVVHDNVEELAWVPRHEVLSVRDMGPMRLHVGYGIPVTEWWQRMQCTGRTGPVMYEPPANPVPYTPPA